MRNRTQLAGMILAALGVAVTLRGAFEGDSVVLAVLGGLVAAVGFGLIFHGHYRGR